MRQLLWLSLIPLTAYWLFAVDIYGYTPALAPAAISILLGIALSIPYFSRIGAVQNRRCTSAAIVPLALACVLIPYPYNAGLITISVALAISLAAPKLKPLWLAALFSGIVVSIQSLALAIYYILAPNYHRMDWMSSGLSFMANLVELKTSSNGGLLLVYAQKKVFPFTITLEKLGFYPWILIFAGAIALIFLTSSGARQSGKRIAGVAILSIVYIILRFLLLVHVTFATDLPQYASERMELFINPILLISSFVPLMLLFSILYPINESKLSFSLDLSLDKRQSIALAAIAMSFLCMASAVTFQDPGVRKEGRVLVDEIHSAWEFSTLKLDDRWYGESSTYNSYSMIQWLNDTYRMDRIVSPSYERWEVKGATKVRPNLVSDKITYDILKNYDIFIIKTPSQYEPDEIDAIVRFAQNGGGVFLIGDHTNFAGTGTNLNQILGRFGIELGFDSVNSMSGELYYYKRGMLPHPCVKYTPYLDFMTGCSIKAPIGSEPVILGTGLLSEPGEYASSGFFRETRSNDPTQVTNTVWGLINQAVALKYGKGRIVVFSDSTIISNFRVFYGGTPNLLIGCMEYLNYANLYQNARQALLLLGIALGALAVFLLGRSIWGDRKLMALVMILALGSLFAGISLNSFSIKAEDSIPSKFYVKDHTVCFDGEHSYQIVGNEGTDGNYDTFFVWTQRINLTPSIEDSFSEAMEKGRILVMIDPIKALSPEESAELQDCVKNGSSVLLMLPADGPGSNLTQPFGLDTYSIEQPAGAENETLSVDLTHGLPIKPWGLAIKGGKPLMSIGDRVVMAEAGYGKGKFVLFTDSRVFMDGLYEDPGYMGYSESDPETMTDLGYDLASLYKLEFSAFKGMLAGNSDHRDLSNPVESKR